MHTAALPAAFPDRHLRNALFAVATAFAATLALLPSTAHTQAARPAIPIRMSALPLEANGEPLELATLSSLRITQTGSVLFADTKPVTLRMRDGKSGEIHPVSRAGSGPNEFRGAPGLIGFTADSIAAFDANLQRWSLFSPAGAFVRIMATGPEAQQYETSAAWMADGAIVYNATLGKTHAPLGPIVKLIVDASGKSDAPIVIRQANNGDLWTAPALESKNWLVYDRAGQARVSFTFPRAFRFEFANDTVAIGESVDADDLPQIMRVSLRGISAAPKAKSLSASAAGTVDASDAERVAARAQLTKVLKSMVGKQEMAYSDSMHYTTSVRALKLDLPATISVQIIDANKHGWFGVARDTKLHMTCSLGVGFTIPMGWNEAKPYCSQ